MSGDEPPIFLGAERSVTDIGVARKAKELREELDEANATIERLQQALKSTAAFTVLDGAISEHSRKPCKYHIYILVDQESPIVRCRHCDTELDPWSVLLEIARKERHLLQWSESYRKDQQNLAEEIERLKVQRSRLRSQVRKLGGDPDESAAWSQPLLRGGK